MTGGTGLIGRAVARALAMRGDEIVVVTRHAAGARLRLPGGTVIVESDPTQPGPWQAEITDADAVINLAGLPLASGRWTGRRKREFRRSRLETTHRIVEAINRYERRRTLLTASAVGFYGDGGREPLYEEREASSDYLGRLAFEWERCAAGASSRTRVIPLRFGMVLAKGEGALVRMVPPFRLGLGGAMGNGKQFVAWIHLDDAVRAVLAVLDDPSYTGPVNITAPDPPQQREFAEILGRILGRPAILPVPAFVIRLLLGEMATLVLTSSRAVPKALRARGFEFHHGGLEEALRDSVGIEA